MNKNKIVLSVYAVFALILGVVGGIFRRILTTEFFDAEVGLYNFGTDLPEAFWIFIASCILFALSAIVLTDRRSLPTSYRPYSGLSGVAAVLTGIALLYSAVMFFKESKTVVSRSGDELTLYRFELVCAIFAVLSFVYFLADAFSKLFDSIGEWAPKARAVLSLFPALWAATYLMAVYFDRALVLNSPIRVVHQAALITLVLFTLAGARMQVGKAKPLLFVPITLFSLVFTLTWVIPEIMTLIDSGKLSSFASAKLLTEFAFCLLMAARLVDYARLSGELVTLDGGAYSEEDDRDYYGETFEPYTEAENADETEEYTENTDDFSERDNYEDRTEYTDPAEETGSDEKNHGTEEIADTVEETGESENTVEDEDENVVENEIDEDQVTFEQLLASDGAPEQTDPEKTDPQQTDGTVERTEEPFDGLTTENADKKDEELPDGSVQKFLEDLSRRLDGKAAPAEEKEEPSAAGTVALPTARVETIPVPEAPVGPKTAKPEPVESGKAELGSGKKAGFDISDNDILKYISELTGEKIDVTRPEPEVREPQDEPDGAAKGEYSNGEILKLNFDYGEENRRLRSRDFRDVFNKEDDTEN